MGGITVACIPAHNEERTIARVVIQAQKYVDRVVVCDDGSSDMTAEITEKLGATVVRHERNVGYGAALRSLFGEARRLDADVVVTLDADGQHDPKMIPSLLEPTIRGEADIVIGSRFLGNEQEIPTYRRFGIEIITKFGNVCSRCGIRDAQSGFRAYNRKALDLLEPTECGMGASLELLMKAQENRLTVKEIPIVVEYTVEKPSECNPLYHGLDVVASTVKHLSIRHPLFVYGIPGLLLCIMGILFGFWALDIFSKTRELVTNIALLSSGSLILGVLLMATGMILFTMISVLREEASMC